MRGRLIFRFLAELRRLDRAAMRDDPDGAGPLTSGYDEDFREPVVLDAATVSPRRLELPAVRVPCQVEPQLFGLLQETPIGDAPRSDTDLVFHFRDLERLGLVEPATGNALIAPGDRLAGLFDLAGEPVAAVPHPPGLFVREARPTGFGLHRRRPCRNLLLVSFHTRALTPRRIA